METDSCFLEYRLELDSALQPAECAKRILAAINIETTAPFAGLSSSHPVTGNVDGSTIQLHKYYGSRYPAQTFLTATLESHGDGTRVHGVFGVHPMNRFVILAFYVLAMLGVAAISYRLEVPGANDPSSPVDPLWLSFLFIFIPPAAFVILLIQFLSARKAPREEAQFLTHFLRSTLEAD